MSKFKKGDRVTVTEDESVRKDSAITVHSGHVGTVRDDTYEEYCVSFDHLTSVRYIQPKYLQKVPQRRADPQDYRRIAMDRLINAGLLAENGDTRLGLLGIAAFIGADTSETGDKVIAALLGNDR